MSKAEEKPVSEYGEPWKEDGCCAWADNGEGVRVADCWTSGKATCDRIVACVNSLAGIPNPEAVREVLKEARFVRAALKLGDLCASDLKRLDEAFESLSAPSTGAQQKGE